MSEQGLAAETGYAVVEWPLYLVKELLDNALDACEEARIAPEISIEVDQDGIRSRHPRRDGGFCE